MKTDKNIGSFLPPALLAEVEAIATREHRPVQEVIQDAVSSYIRHSDVSSVSTLTPQEKVRLFREWIESRPLTQPLSDEAIKRENMIRDVF